MTYNYEKKIADQVMGWRSKASLVPYMRFPEDWEVRVTPPFAGADARFSVRRGTAAVSVYLDFDSNLGCMDEPYWEIHPIHGDCARYMLNDTDDLLRGIEYSLRQQEADDTPATLYPDNNAPRPDAPEDV